ncbi:MAG: hypothetical protein GY772_15430 [bacterium]|nr:hypothetical protein [bacterium]
MASIVTATGTERVKQSMVKLDDLARTAKVGADTAMIRIPPRGNADDLSWVPEPMATARTMPENRTTFGSPWLLRTTTGAFRFGPASVPLHGVGAFLVGVKNTAAVMTWDIAAMLEVGDTPESAFETLGHMKAADFREWFDSNVRFTELAPKASVWVPYGYAVMLIEGTVLFCAARAFLRRCASGSGACPHLGIGRRFFEQLRQGLGHRRCRGCRLPPTSHR